MHQPINLILLPGMDGTNLLLSPIVAEIEKQLPQVNCICVAYPSATLMDYHQLAEYVRQKIPPNQPYILLGESFSGPVAVLVAANAGSMLKGVILAVTFVRNPKPTFTNMGHLLPSINVSTAKMTQYGMPIISKFLLGEFTSVTFRKSLKNAIDQVPIAILRYRLQQVLAVDVAEELARVQVPMLYILAKQDLLVKRNAYEVIKGYKPNIELVELPGPHMILQVLPKEVVFYTKKFIAKCI